MNTITYVVPNISCQHCVHTIKTELSEMQGVVSVNGDVDTKKVVVSFEEPASQPKIEKLLAEIDYPVQK